MIKSLDTIAEIRRFEEPNNFFEKLSPGEQKEFANELFSRLQYDFTNVSICLLDTGLNNGHPLLSGSCEDDCLQSVNAAWQTSDHDGHGTEMAGVALFHNLKEKLLSKEKIVIHHRLESVKILPPPPGANDPQLYGDITKQAISLAEIARPNNVRTLCMAITEDDKYSITDGTPSSWSGSIDTIISGADDDTKRLFFISAGNVDFSDMKAGYPDANLISPVQSPGQAWNAITVGAFSNDITILDENLKSYHAVANSGELSPYSSTSKIWASKWPIKPEILCDGGNVATDGSAYMDCSDLSLLTTSHQHLKHPFSTICATSSATAQASWIAAQIMSEYPGIWPETVRALIVHSADWTSEMKRLFIAGKDKKGYGRRDLLRTCGYGIPNLERAIQCISNRVNLVIEGEIQPFAKNKKMKEMHLHTLPWASDILRSIGETPALLKITLSYFVEPGPGEIGWRDKYRYPSCQLRFDVKNINETKKDFLKRIDVKMREDNDRGSGYSGSTEWFLGPQNRDVGSIHSDFKKVNAVDLCDANFVAVYSVIGWWRERTNLKLYDKKVRYSLIVSISTPETDVDLYTPIITQIQQPVSIPV
ncbi:Y4bN protein [Treponema primitia ZAS-2]|uniref:Y4bN protein n=1 Tax=Treponema primitia (strain ATCC BAA-887 / DSM 12427 / ZAS-2) TaxID=545694 RepID=F5YQD6_TREPZ